MYKHIVMWKLKPEAEGRSKLENAQFMKSNLEGLKESIPEIITIEVGIDVSNTNSSFDVVLYSEFNDRDACEIYATHPDHVAVSDQITPLRLERVVVDYDV